MKRPFDIWSRLTISGDSLSWLSTRPIAGLGSLRYEGQPGEDLVEIAIAVDPDWRRVGLGHRLLKSLGEAAATRGIHRLVAAYSCGEPRRRGSPAVHWASLSHVGVARRCRGAARTAAHRIDQPGRSTAGVEVVDDLGVVLVRDASFDLHRGSQLPGLDRQVMGQQPELADTFDVRALDIDLVDACLDLSE